MATNLGWSKISVGPEVIAVPSMITVIALSAVCSEMTSDAGLICSTILSLMPAKWQALNASKLYKQNTIVVGRGVILNS